MTYNSLRQSNGKENLLVFVGTGEQVVKEKKFFDSLNILLLLQNEESLSMFLCLRRQIVDSRQRQNQHRRNR